MKTPYELHAEFEPSHRMVTYSPNGIDTIEECADCGQRWLWRHGQQRPDRLNPLAQQSKRSRKADNKAAIARRIKEVVS